MSERRAVIRVAASRYRQATKKQKGHILDELVAVTGYHRFYAATLLKLQGRRLRIGQRRYVVGDLRLRTPRARPRVYTDKVVKPLCRIWAILDGLCRKRLAAILPEVIRVLEQHKEIKLDADTR